MTEETRQDADELTARVPINPADPAEGVKGNPLLRLPGLIFIGLYMLALSAVVTVRVVTHRANPVYLVLAALFLTASFGLMRLFRWAWALTLGAVFLPMSYCLWLLLHHGMPAEVGAIQIGLNLLLFLYLVRVEMRAALR
uniref:Uncharacterized protein n=1 Tax=mine drainage metagenome TaxID=410659 RepID=E6QKT1_9ZZZZ